VFIAGTAENSSRRDKIIWWSMVSKATDKSKSTSTAEFPESAVKIRSLKTLRRAVSVKPD